MSKKIRVVSYHRIFETEQGKKGYSLQEQEEACKAYAEDNGMEYVKGYSDKLESRDLISDGLALKQLIEDSAKGIFDRVLVWKSSRIARSYLELVHIYRILQENNVSFHSLTEPVESSTPAGKLLMNMLECIVESEKDLFDDKEGEVICHSLTEQVDPSTPTGKLLMTMLESIIESEKDLFDNKEGELTCQER